MNEHIELVKKWLADPESVTQAELDDNAEAARAAQKELKRFVSLAAAQCAATWVAWAAENAAEDAYVDAYDDTAARYDVERYEELIECEAEEKAAQDADWAAWSESVRRQINRFRAEAPVPPR